MFLAHKTEFCLLYKNKWMEKIRNALKLVESFLSDKYQDVALNGQASS